MRCCHVSRGAGGVVDGGPSDAVKPAPIGCHWLVGSLEELSKALMMKYCRAITARTIVTEELFCELYTADSRATGFYGARSSQNRGPGQIGFHVFVARALSCLSDKLGLLA